MIYLSSFSFPDGEEEQSFFMSVKRTCYDSFYPFGQIVKKEISILKVKIPMETVIEEDKNGKKKAVERKLFPCYILIKMRYTDSLWHTIVNSRGVTGFVGPQGRPLPLTDEEVKQVEDMVNDAINKAISSTGVDVLD